ncbi:MAG: hypothetical protein AAF368_04785, partial [Planctomycetota bacterium]
LLVLLVLAFVGLYFYLDKLAEKGIEEGGTLALEVPVEVDGVSLDVFGGKLTLDGLKVDNPVGYGENDFFDLGNATVEVDLQSVQGNVIRIPELRVDGVNLDIVKNTAGTNYGRIMEALEKFSSAEEAEEANPTKSGPPAKKFVVDHILIENVSATADLSFFGQDLDPVSVSVPPIEVHNFGTAENAHSASDLLKMLLREMLDGVLAEGGGLLPAGLLDDMKSQVANLQSDLMNQGQALLDDTKNQINDKVEEVQGEVQNQVDSLKGELNEKVQDLQGEGQNAVDDLLQDGKKGLEEAAGGALDSLFGKDKKTTDG